MLWCRSKHCGFSIHRHGCNSRKHHHLIPWYNWKSIEVSQTSDTDSSSVGIILNPSLDVFFHLQHSVDVCRYLWVSGRVNLFTSTS